MRSWNEILETLKMWGFLIMMISPVVACSYWLAEDDKRMRNEFMETCQKQKIEKDCFAAFSKAYRETFGRNP